MVLFFFWIHVIFNIFVGIFLSETNRQKRKRINYEHGEKTSLFKDFAGNPNPTEDDYKDIALKMFINRKGAANSFQNQKHRTETLNKTGLVEFLRKDRRP